MKAFLLILLLLFGGGALAKSCQGPDDPQGWCIDFVASADTWGSASQDQIVSDTSHLANKAPDEVRDTADALAKAALQDDTVGLAAHEFVLRQQCGN